MFRENTDDEVTTIRSDGFVADDMSKKKDESGLSKTLPEFFQKFATNFFI